MKHKFTFALLIFLAVEILVVLMMLFSSGRMVMFDPQGAVALAERNLIITAAGLMALVVVPVLVLTFVIAWRYRAGNTKAKYSPNWDKNAVIEGIWWSIPCCIILVLAIITWNTTHSLDPFRPLESNVTPITIQVVALDWKWLFIYPEEGIATVNFIEAPVGTPINFELTADAPMNSFWIPQLAGQIYAMTGMVTKLHLIADAPGTYAGSSANISGRGFAGMNFSLKAVSKEEYKLWLAEVRSNTKPLTHEAYTALAQPSENAPITYFGSVDQNLFTTIVHSFMPPADVENGHTMDMHEMQM